MTEQLDVAGDRSDEDDAAEPRGRRPSRAPGSFLTRARRFPSLGRIVAGVRSQYEECERGLADCRAEGDVDQTLRAVGADEGCILALSEWEKDCRGEDEQAFALRDQPIRTGSGETARLSDPALWHHGKREGRGEKGLRSLEGMFATVS
jgi:hypothetical protein